MFDVDLNELKQTLKQKLQTKSPQAIIQLFFLINLQGFGVLFRNSFKRLLACVPQLSGQFNRDGPPQGKDVAKCAVLFCLYKVSQYLIVMNSFQQNEPEMQPFVTTLWVNGLS